MRALIDTSVLTPAAAGTSFGHIMDTVETEISAITVAELAHAVLTAGDRDRPTRLATLSTIESYWDPLPVDLEVAHAYARGTAALRACGRRLPTIDALVAATAAAQGISLITVDRDYDDFPGVHVIRL